MRNRNIDYVLIALGLLIMMVAPGHALSNGLFGDDDYVIPYEDGYGENIPSAAARLVLEGTRNAPQGALFSFGVEVFDTAWEPVYEIRIEGVDETVIEAAGWPLGWRTPAYTRAYDDREAGVSFHTETNPIQPGASLGGFTVYSESRAACLRWYPVTESGELLGKVTRTMFACPTAVERQTWGAIKAYYR